MAIQTPQLMSLAARGLWTYNNQFSAPDGAMAQALNVSIDRDGVVETARGLESIVTPTAQLNTYAMTLVNNCMVLAAGSTNGPLDPGLTPQNLYIVSNLNEEVLLNGQYYLLGTGLVHNLSVNAANCKLDCFTAKQNIYVSTSGGVMRLNGQSSNPGANGTFTNFGAGMVKPIAPEFTYAASGTGILAANTCYMYRTVYGRFDSNQNLILGPPSEAVIVYTGATQFAVTVRQALPGKWMQPGDVVQVYRSTSLPFTGSSPSSTGIPLDELQLATEYVIQSSDLTAATPNFISIPDTCQDSTLGAYLYTDQNNGTGINSSQFPPPLAQCATIFKNIALYANTRQPPTVQWKFIINSAGNTNPTSFTVSNGTTTYTATTGVLGTQYTQASPGNGTMNMVATSPALYAMAFASVISNNNSDVVVYYLGLAESSAAAGAIQNIPFLASAGGFASANYTLQLQTYGVGDRENGTWTVAAVGGNLVNYSVAPLPQTAVPDLGPNRVYYSVPNQPESVPLLNYIEVGSRSSPVLAVTPLRNSIFVWRRDGLFRLTPNVQPTGAVSMNLELFDETVQLTHENSVRKGGNRLFASCSRGFMEVTESNARTISDPIEDIASQVCVDLNTYPLSTAAASDAEKKYAFCALSSSTPTVYIWNWVKQTWVTRQFTYYGGINPGIVNGLAGGTFGTTSGTSGLPKYSDRLWVCFASGLTQPPYDIIPLYGTQNYGDLPSVTYVVIDANNPGAKKRFTQCTVVTTGSTLTALNATFATETTPASEVVPFTNVTTGVMRCIIPQGYQYCSQLTLTISAPNHGDYLKLSGVSLAVDTVTLNTNR